MKALNLTQKLIKSHLVDGEMIPGREIGIRIDQVLQQDATGTLVMLELDSIGLDHVKAEVAAQYVDHNLLQTDYKNADDHLFLQSAANKLGYWYSRAGNGISHVVHMENFGVPGKSLLGSDSHTCAGGGLGMLAIGTGGLDVALAAAGEPYYVQMPKVMGIELKGKLPDWVSAKDVVLEMLRRFDVSGGKGFVLEYFGEGVRTLSAWDRHVIANMGTELGATTSVFPSDKNTQLFLKKQYREEDYSLLAADKDAVYDHEESLDLAELEPLIACPSSPGNVVRVKEVAGREVSQVVIGSSANPGYRDFWIAGQMLHDRQIQPGVSLDINPSSRQVIQALVDEGVMSDLVASGARFHQTGCLGCIGMGQSPATGEISLRTMPRNFPGRSGTRDDQVYLCSPETAIASALTGKITVPSDMKEIFGLNYPVFREPEKVRQSLPFISAPKPQSDENTELKMGPNIQPLPEFEELHDNLVIPVILKMGDNVSTDEILKAGTKVLPLRSNIPEISKYAYYDLSSTYYQDALDADNGHLVVAGNNYAQGSSREHAALAPRYLGQKAVIAKSYARIGWQNLINFGIVPLEFRDPEDYDQIENGDVFILGDLKHKVEKLNEFEIINGTKETKIKVSINVSPRQRKILLAGGVINYLRTLNLMLSGGGEDLI